MHTGCPTDSQAANATNMGYQYEAMTCWIILYADDIVIFTDSETKLQEMLDILQSVFADWGVEINGPKTKIIQVGAHGSSSGAAVMLNGDYVECVPTFKYLGS